MTAKSYMKVRQESGRFFQGFSIVGKCQEGPNILRLLIMHLESPWQDRNLPKTSIQIPPNFLLCRLILGLDEQTVRMTLQTTRQASILASGGEQNELLPVLVDCCSLSAALTTRAEEFRRLPTASTTTTTAGSASPSTPAQIRTEKNTSYVRVVQSKLKNQKNSRTTFNL